MNKLLGPLYAIALLAWVGAALAAEATGTIQSVDPATRVIVLEDGTTFAAATGLEIETLQPGMQVTLVYEEGENGFVASEVKPIQ